jgi:hypothetical protein
MSELVERLLNDEHGITVRAYSLLCDTIEADVGEDYLDELDKLVKVEEGRVYIPSLNAGKLLELR